MTNELRKALLPPPHATCNFVSIADYQQPAALFNITPASILGPATSLPYTMRAKGMAFQAPRRPRAHPGPRAPSLSPLRPPLPAYAVPPPVLLAVATLAAAALRHLFELSPKYSLRTLAQTLRTNLHALRPPRPAPVSAIPIRRDQESRLDALRDRSIAELDALQPAPEDYSNLLPVQRRALLQSALQRAYNSKPAPPLREEPLPAAVVEETKVVAKKSDAKRSKFWNVAEQINGRAAALGFMLCLAREVTEPGHPSLFEQVVDVVVPIAQKTPPFLVAVVDRLVDLVT